MLFFNMINERAVGNLKVYLYSTLCITAGSQAYVSA